MAAPAEEETVLQGRDMPAIFRLWEEKHSTPGFDSVAILTRCVILCENLCVGVDGMLCVCVCQKCHAVCVLSGLFFFFIKHA